MEATCMWSSTRGITQELIKSHDAVSALTRVCQIWQRLPGQGGWDTEADHANGGPELCGLLVQGRQYSKLLQCLQRWLLRGQTTTDSCNKSLGSAGSRSHAFQFDSAWAARDRTNKISEVYDVSPFVSAVQRSANQRFEPYTWSWDCATIAADAVQAVGAGGASDDHRALMTLKSVSADTIILGKIDASAAVKGQMVAKLSHHAVNAVFHLSGDSATNLIFYVKLKTGHRDINVLPQDSTIFSTVDLL